MTFLESEYSSYKGRLKLETVSDSDKIEILTSMVEYSVTRETINVDRIDQLTKTIEEFDLLKREKEKLKEEVGVYKKLENEYVKKDPYRELKWKEVSKTIGENTELKRVIEKLKVKDKPETELTYLRRIVENFSRCIKE